MLKQSGKLHCNITTYEVQVLLSFPMSSRMKFTHFLLPHCMLKCDCIFKKFMTEIEQFFPMFLFFFKIQLLVVLLDHDLKLVRNAEIIIHFLDTGNIFNRLMFCFQAAECLHLSDVHDSVP